MILPLVYSDILSFLFFEMNCKVDYLPLADLNCYFVTVVAEKHTNSHVRFPHSNHLI